VTGGSPISRRGRPKRGSIVGKREIVILSSNSTPLLQAVLEGSP